MPYFDAGTPIIQSYLAGRAQRQQSEEFAASQAQKADLEQKARDQAQKQFESKLAQEHDLAQQHIELLKNAAKLEHAKAKIEFGKALQEGSLPSTPTVQQPPKPEDFSISAPQNEQPPTRLAPSPPLVTPDQFGISADQNAPLPPANITSSGLADTFGSEITVPSPQAAAAAKAELLRPHYEAAIAQARGISNAEQPNKLEQLGAKGQNALAVTREKAAAELQNTYIKGGMAQKTAEYTADKHLEGVNKMAAVHMAVGRMANPLFGLDPAEANAHLTQRMLGQAGPLPGKWAAFDQMQLAQNGAVAIDPKRAQDFEHTVSIINGFFKSREDLLQEHANDFGGFLNASKATIGGNVPERMRSDFQRKLAQTDSETLAIRSQIEAIKSNRLQKSDVNALSSFKLNPMQSAKENQAEIDKLKDRFTKAFNTQLADVPAWQRSLFIDHINDTVKAPWLGTTETGGDVKMPPAKQTTSTETPKTMIKITDKKTGAVSYDYDTPENRKKNNAN